ncbi:molybdopterin-synthase adenylyltransferase [Candidatus Thiomargarita nelsonii]|uniref:Molybdopterin-synthase adenylyltransferase n=1 Tax=Candidatus Thiomargarita nelsonii TaxID=1003181 RepID=A0A0A6PK57_9GAMM|nr:molybdopterin-synthase adenylyltransferase [Candidatus Thiomargarita nelsonii]
MNNNHRSPKFILDEKKVLIIGLGGLGSPVAMYLAAAGVGHLVLADFDRVDLSNLQRQIVHDTTQIGQYKTISAQTKLQALNPDIEISFIKDMISEDFLIEDDIDVVVDCSDNFATRFIINAACVHAGTPLVSGAALRWGGQVAVFSSSPQSPCYRCLYSDNEDEGEACSDAGILAPLVGVIGSIQAVEVIKVLCGIGNPLSGRLLLFDALSMQWRTLKLHKDPTCPICSN